MVLLELGPELRSWSQFQIMKNRKHPCRSGVIEYSSVPTPPLPPSFFFLFSLPLSFKPEFPFPPPFPLHRPTVDCICMCIKISVSVSEARRRFWFIRQIELPANLKVTKP